MSRKRNITQLDEINEPTPSAIIHGAITSVSPIKKGRLNTQFFDATLADKTSSLRVVGCSHQQQIQLHELHKNKSPVELVDCVVKNSRQGQGYDIMLKSSTKIKLSPKKLDMETIMSSTLPSKQITLNSLTSLSQYDQVSVNIKVLQLQAVEEVDPDKKHKRDVIVSDQTASAKVVLWEEHVDSLQEGKSYLLKNFHVKELKPKKTSFNAKIRF